MRPDRAVYVISVAAELAGVHPQTLRIYERKGLRRPGPHRRRQPALQRRRHRPAPAHPGAHHRGPQPGRRAAGARARGRVGRLAAPSSTRLERQAQRRGRRAPTASTGATWSRCTQARRRSTGRPRCRADSDPKLIQCHSTPRSTHGARPEPLDDQDPGGLQRRHRRWPERATTPRSPPTTCSPPCWARRRASSCPCSTRSGVNPLPLRNAGRRGRRPSCPRPTAARSGLGRDAAATSSTRPTRERTELSDEYLSTEHLLLALADRLERRPRGAAHRAAARCGAATGSPRQNPEEQLPGAREVRPRPHRGRPPGQARPGHRPRRGDPPGHPGAVPPHQEQPGAHRRARRRQDRHRRGPRPPHRRGRRARGPEEQAAHHPRPRLDGRRRQVPRRVRGAPQGRAQGDHRRRRRGHHLHRRAAHDRRRRRGRGRDGRRQHAQADARPRRAAHDRRHHARRVPQAHREGRRPRAPLPAGVRRPAVGRGHDRHPPRPEGALRGAPRRAHPGRRPRRRRRAVRPLPHRPLPARQGHRPRRRGRQPAAHRDRLDADRDRRRRAPHPPARDRAGRAGQGDRRRRRRSGSTPSTSELADLTEQQGRHEGALAVREGRHRRHPRAQGGARARAGPRSSARPTSSRRPRSATATSPSSSARSTRPRKHLDELQGDAADAEGGGRRGGHRRGRLQVDRRPASAA